MHTKLAGAVSAALLLVAALLPKSVRAQVHAHEAATGHQDIRIPSALRAEHAEIHDRLEAATKLTGATGEAARALAQVLHPHFTREEQIALPPLGLLEPLASGRYDAAMSAVLPLTDSLRAELSRMLAEHKEISAATRRMGEAAEREGQTAVAKLSGQLLLHAQNEEQVTYPAAILVGDVVRARAERVLK